MSKETIATTLMLAGSILGGVAYCVAQQLTVSQSQTSQAHRPDQTTSPQIPPTHKVGTPMSPENRSPSPNVPTATPPAPHAIMINAIFSQLNPSDPLYDRFGSVLASPLIDGVSTALNWATIDQGPGAAGGQYQWRTFDRGIQRFIDAGKKVNLMVQPISYGSTNTATPSYVMNDTAGENVACQSGADGGNAAYYTSIAQTT